MRSPARVSVGQNFCLVPLPFGQYTLSFLREKMRASHSLVLLVLTFTAVSVAGYLRAPLETSHVRESPSDNKRYISDPLGFESVVYTSSVTIGAKSYRLVVVRPRIDEKECSNLASGWSRLIATTFFSSPSHFRHPFRVPSFLPRSLHLANLFSFTPANRLSGHFHRFKQLHNRTSLSK